MVALGEVMTADAAGELVAALNGAHREAASGSAASPSERDRWSFVQSPHGVGHGERYQEWYAVLYRGAARCNAASAVFYPDGDDQFVRDPFGVECKIGNFDFWLVALHVVFGKKVSGRADEVGHLGDVFRWFAHRDPAEHDVVLGGDFNLVPNNVAWSHLPASLERLVPREMLTCMGPDGHLAHHYDDLIIDPAATSELVTRGRSIDIVSFSGDGAAAYRTMSDHLPIVADFRVDAPDDDP